MGLHHHVWLVFSSLKTKFKVKVVCGLTKKNELGKTRGLPPKQNAVLSSTPEPACDFVYRATFFLVIFFFLTCSRSALSKDVSFHSSLL